MRGSAGPLITRHQPTEDLLHRITNRVDGGREGVASSSQLLNLHVEGLATNYEIVENLAASLVGLLDNRTSLFASPLDNRISVNASGLFKAHRGGASLFFFRRRGDLRLIDNLQCTCLSVNEILRRALLGLGEKLRRSLLSFRSDFGTLIVGSTQDRS